MRNIIFWFSGSGNSLAAAEAVGKNFGDAKLVRITKKSFNYNMDQDTEQIVFVFPVHAWRVPSMVLEFAESLELDNVKRIYAVATAGGFIANAFSYLEKVLQKKGHSIYASKLVQMPDNCIYLYNTTASRSYYNEVLKNAEAFLEQNMDFKESDAGIPSCSKGSDILFSKMIGRMFNSSLKKFDQKFFADEKCSSCGICSRICPNMNISLNEDRKPVWNGDCSACMACIHLCPEEAVNRGKSTVKRTRYRWPGVEVKDFFI